MESITDGIGLHHVAHEAQSKGDRNCKKRSHEGTEFPLERGLDVINRSSGDFTRFIGLLVLLRQHCLTINGGHSKESGHPHPEHSAGAAGSQSCGTAGNVTCTDLGSNRGRQRLEGAHTLLACSLTYQLDIAEGPAHTLAEFSNLDKSGADRKKYAAAQKQEQ